MTPDPNRARRSELKILQLTALPFPPEIRVVKEGLALVAAGYQSAVMCPPIAGRAEREEWNGIRIFRPRRLASAATFLDKLSYRTLFYSPSWRSALADVIEEYRPNVLHVHDIWLARTVFHARVRQKVVVDLHENMPAAVVEYLRGYRGLSKWFNAVFRNYTRVFRYERRILTRSDRTLVVVKEARDRVLESHPDLLPASIINVENLESRRFVAEDSSASQVGSGAGVRERLVGPNSILYIGGFGPHRGIDTLVRAARVLKDSSVPAEIYLVGARKSAFLDSIRQLIDELDVRDRIHIVEWVPAESVLEYIRQSSVCAVPHHSNSHTNTTIPHKLYQYMIARKAVLVSTSPPLARTVAAAGAGLVFTAGDPHDCAKKIETMLSAPESLQTFGENGLRYVLQQGHNWEEESAPILIHAYDELLSVGS